MATNVISKITVRDVQANPDMVKTMTEPADVAQRRWPLMRVYGVARGIKEVKSNNRTTGAVDIHLAIQGDFRAVNMKTGVRYASGLLYLPAGIHDLILAPLQQAKEANASAELEFGLDVYSRVTSSPAGYGYVAVMLGEDPTVKDAMATLEERLSKTAGVPALPAPPDAAPAAAIEDKSAKGTK